MQKKELSPDELQLMAAPRPTILDNFQMTQPAYREWLDRERVGTVEWGVAGYFLVNKSKIGSKRALKEPGFKRRPAISKEMFQAIGEEGIKSALWDRMDIGLDGTFIFPPGKLVLAHTDTDITVPEGVKFRMHDRLIDRNTRQEYALTPHLKAPDIQSGNTGPQTYEILNLSKEPITVVVQNLVCVLDVLPLDAPAENGNGTTTYGSQLRGVIRQGNPYNGNGHKKIIAA
jgi:hypothetical protein